MASDHDSFNAAVPCFLSEVDKETVTGGTISPTTPELLSQEEILAVTAEVSVTVGDLFVQVAF